MYTFKRNRLIRDAIFAAIYEEMKIDPAIYIMGEGGSIKVHYDAPMIEREFQERVLTLPISEDGNTNFGVGASLLGVKPIVDVITADFLYRTMDSICNTAAKINFVSGGIDDPKTIIIRSEFLTAGPTTGQRIEALFTHIPGLNVIVPSNPYDAKGLMCTALTTPGVTVFFEDREIPDSSIKPDDRALETNYKIPLGSAKIRRTGDSLTIVSYALTLNNTESIVEKNKVDCDLIDLRSIYPLDFSTISSSVKKTGKLLIVEPDIVYAGVGAEIAAQVAEKCWDNLEKPLLRLGMPRVTIPATASLHKNLLPSEEQILSNVQRMIQ